MVGAVPQLRSIRLRKKKPKNEHHYVFWRGYWHIIILLCLPRLCGYAAFRRISLIIGPFCGDQQIIGMDELPSELRGNTFSSCVLFEKTLKISRDVSSCLQKYSF
jgi:hypothetical protein